MNDAIRQLKSLFDSAQHIAVLSGAGMSTESGLPDYRSTSGLYRTLTSEEVFDIDRFRADPREFYQVIGPLYQGIVSARPNAGHLALAELERRGKIVEIATQNIDGLHQKAGSSHVYQVHGTMETLTCSRCHRQVKAADYADAFPKGDALFCQCGHVLKPDITFYGEMLPQDAFENAVNAFQSADLAMVLGTSLKVYPAAMLPSYRRPGVPLVIINMTVTDADSEATLVIHEKSGAVLSEAIASN